MVITFWAVSRRDITHAFSPTYLDVAGGVSYECWKEWAKCLDVRVSFRGRRPKLCGHLVPSRKGLLGWKVASEIGISPFLPIVLLHIKYSYSQVGLSLILIYH